MVNEKYIIKISGKEYVLFAGLLEEAHKKGLKSIDVQLIQIPDETNENTAICKSTITGSNGEIFSDIGDANLNNVSSKIAPHLIRMASTRATARCLRNYCCIDMCSFEELNPDDMEAESATLAQLNLLKKLSGELGIKIDLASLDKQAASSLISELSAKKKTLRIAK